MKDGTLLGRGDRIHEVPADAWLAHLDGAQHNPSERLDFMTPGHHLVRNFTVAELPRNDGKPLRPDDIARRLKLRLATVESLLDDLQAHLFFLVLNPAGEATWAFPVTVEETPHRLSFSSGETVYAA